jgi:putative membrane protein
MGMSQRPGLLWPCRVYLLLLVFALVGSGLVRAGFDEPVWVARLSGLAVTVFGVWALLASLRPDGWVLAAGAASLALGAGSEVVGLFTGFPFGRYEYTDAWWPVVTLAGGSPFPVQLPLAWLMLSWSAVLVARRWVMGWAAVVFGGLLAALADLVMEPTTVHSLGYWRWLDGGPLPGGVPLANFFGWWLVAGLAGALLLWAQPDPETRPEPVIVLVGHAVFMVLLGLVRG